MRIVFNGQLCEEEEARVSVFDRSFCYGDGLFETFRIHNGRAFRLTDHLDRLRVSADALGFVIPFTADNIEDHIDALVSECEMPEAMARINLSRGIGRRGYSPRGVNTPSYVMALHSAPDINAGRPIAWRMKTSSYRLNPSDPLLSHKTASRLTNVLAKAEAEENGYDDAFFINLEGNVAEATCANVFWFEGNVVCTPPLSSGGLPGITRQAIFEICRDRGLNTEEKDLPLERLHVIDGAFLTLSSLGVIEISRVDQTILPIHETTRALHRAWWEKMIKETS
ncbi:MAG: aminotransferase class IV [Limisphaerales bacterium]